MTFLPNDFMDFIAPSTDRCTFLTQWLSKNGIDCTIIPIENSKHIYINFAKTAYDPFFKIKTLLVHYDRADGSPGANDNSAAVFQVLSFIKRLWHYKGAHNMRIFITDGEEMGALGGVADQGAYGIASKFKQLGIIKDDIIVVDSCGRGDVLVVSTTGLKCNGTDIFKKRFAHLYERIITLAKTASPSKWVTLPVPYSDNAAFIASGIPAVAITMLPREEASALMRTIQRDKKFEASLLSHTLESTEQVPLTWRFMHTPFDSEATLTEESFVIMERFLDALAQDKTIAG